ncbi:MAG: LysR family transcriptional regulator [Lawsonibacter sp.]|nr:LysR family transcriptional regulator [Lawsonibacter sp.]
MELKQIEYFLQLARLQHVSQTAAFLDISQPTLSKSLANLEKDLGVPLFDRVGNRIRLNASGQRFYTHAQRAMQILDSGALSAKQLIYETSGNVSIICLSFAPILLPCISEYMKLNPMVNVQILQYNHRLNSTADGENYDFILASAQDEVSDEQNTPFWVTQPLFSEHVFLVVGPNHPQFSELPQDGESIDLAQFAQTRFVTMQIGSNFIDFTYHICQNAGFFPQTYFQTDDFLIKMNAIREGLAVAFLPQSCLAEARLLCPGLRTFDIQHCSTHRTVVMMRKKKRLLSESALDFWDFLLEYYRLPGDSRD